jgi:hypothetical protein
MESIVKEKLLLFSGVENAALLPASFPERGRSSLDHLTEG